MFHAARFTAIVAALATTGLAFAAESDKRDSRTDVYAPMSPADVRSRTLEWVALRGAKDPAVREQVGKLWAEDESAAQTTSRQLLERVIATFTVVDPDTRSFVAACKLVDGPLVPPQSSLFDRPDDGEFYASNLRLFFGRYLTQRRMFDEALETLAAVKPQQVVDPATLFFHRSVCQHQLLDKAGGLASLKTLLEDTTSVPPGYTAVADLMKYELEAYQPKSLDEVSRLMTDVGRRLDLGRAGQNVQTREEKIIALLDDIIEKLEQQGGSGPGGAGGTGQNPSNQPNGSPAGDSVVKGAEAPASPTVKARVDKARGAKVPGEKKQVQAKNLINRNFPGNYERAIKEYMKKLAELDK